LSRTTQGLFTSGLFNRWYGGTINQSSGKAISSSIGVEMEAGIQQDVWLCAMLHGHSCGEIQYTYVERIKGAIEGTWQVY